MSANGAITVRPACDDDVSAYVGILVRGFSEKFVMRGVLHLAVNGGRDPGARGALPFLRRLGLLPGLHTLAALIDEVRDERAIPQAKEQRCN